MQLIRLQPPGGRAIACLAKMARMLSIPLLVLAATAATVTAATAIAAPREPTVVCLGRRLPHGYAQGVRGAVLARELVRQGLLIAARDELGLATRDEMLRETTAAPADQAAAERTLRLELMAKTIAKKSINVQIFESHEWLTTAWQRDIPLGDDPIDYRALAETIEPWTRKEFVEFLRLQGCQDRRPTPAEVALDPMCVTRIEEMSFLAQLGVVQQAHANVRAAGPTPQALSLLVRGYAHLGMLTEWHWNSAFKAHFARALLYAQRMIADDAQSPASWAHRAYAETLAGMHAAALEDIATARRLAAEKQLDDALPDWLPLIEASCRYDREPLELAMVAETHPQLSAVLAFMVVEHSLCDPLTLNLGLRVIKIAPESYAPIDSMCRINRQIGAGHLLTVLGPTTLSNTVDTRLRQFAALPQPVVEALDATAKRAAPKGIFGVRKVSEEVVEGAGARAALIRALVAAGPAAGEIVEPSWEAVGRALEDATLVHFYRRLYFVSKSLGIPEESLEEFFKAAAKPVPDHPQKNLLLTNSGKMQRDPARLRSLTKDMPHLDPTFSMHLAMSDTWTGAKDKAFGQVAFAWLSYNFDDVARDLEQTGYAKNSQTKLMHRLQKVSPHSPQAVALLIKYDLPFAQPKLKEWERQFGQHAVVLQSLADVYVKTNRQTDAERTLKAYMAMSPDQWGANALADIYWAQKKPDLWVATLEAAVDLEDYSLGTAQIQRRLARYFLLFEHNPEKALPHAEASAAAGWAWGMTIAGEVHEALGHWKEAEQWHENNSRRYSESAFDWFFWCLRTGHGDAEAAKEVAEAAAKQIALRAGDAECQKLGVFFLLSDRSATARSFFWRSFTVKGNPWSALHVAFLADDEGDIDGRDAALAGAVLRGEKYEDRDVKMPATVSLARWMGNAATLPADRPLDIKLLDGVIKTVDRSERANLCYFAYRFFRKRDPDQARRYLERVLATRAVEKWNYALACVEARKLGLEMPPADETEFLMPNFEDDPAAEPRKPAAEPNAADRDAAEPDQ